ncbi:MAG TPA: hypothetical protein VK050_06465 [Flavobacteriaceae bacterium]|nr:hypothetical protein [Flavobacteriaceae bacterium]
MIEYITDTSGIIQADNVSVTFSENKNPRDLQTLNVSPFNWADIQPAGDFTILPYGSANNLPVEVRDIIHANYIAPGILQKKTQLLWGQGPRLYKEIVKEGELIREWVSDRVIEDWLTDINAEDYLLKSSVDYQHLEGTCTKLKLNRGYRIKGFVTEIEHSSFKYTNLAKKKGDDKPSHMVVRKGAKWKAYPMFDHRNPFKHGTTMLYSNLPSFCSDYYTIPSLYGSLEWLKRSTAIPVILEALSRNSINIKYHIISPAYFWETKREELEDECIKKGKPYKESMLIEFRTEYLEKVANALSDAQNTGKFWHSVKTLEVQGQNILEHGWEIKPIKQDVREFVRSQIDISKRADEALAAGVGLHGALGNINVAGKADSGSEQLYALKNYLQTGIAIPEMIVTKAINLAIKANWPEKDLKLGFYHYKPQAEKNIHSGNRIKENI